MRERGSPMAVTRRGLGEGLTGLEAGTRKGSPHLSGPGSKGRGEGLPGLLGARLPQPRPRHAVGPGARSCRLPLPLATGSAVQREGKWRERGTRPACPERRKRRYGMQSISQVEKKEVEEEEEGEGEEEGEEEREGEGEEKNEEEEKKEKEKEEEEEKEMTTKKKKL
ncbi:cilia- and flagella-associated protein 251-like [Eubalaena glacialis]|uniref:cilia- and flagella-associated protein 251-like n=1 Tax=Eubalaena glacialis TaxID=27606 RepID=UPI002A5B01F8|nr:cilia- and flagella-associated protein 251-like [Eubalaena glacialis]